VKFLNCRNFANKKKKVYSSPMRFFFFGQILWCSQEPSNGVSTRVIQFQLLKRTSSPGSGYFFKLMRQSFWVLSSLFNGSALGSHWVQFLAISPTCESVSHYQTHSLSLMCLCTPQLITNSMLGLWYLTCI